MMRRQCISPQNQAIFTNFDYQKNEWKEVVGQGMRINKLRRLNWENTNKPKNFGGKKVKKKTTKRANNMVSKQEV